MASFLLSFSSLLSWLPYLFFLQGVCTALSSSTDVRGALAVGSPAVVRFCLFPRATFFFLRVAFVTCALLGGGEDLFFLVSREEEDDDDDGLYT